MASTNSGASLAATSGSGSGGFSLGSSLFGLLGDVVTAGGNIGASYAAAHQMRYANNGGSLNLGTTGSTPTTGFSLSDILGTKASTETASTTVPSNGSIDSSMWLKVFGIGAGIILIVFMFLGLKK